MAINPNETLIPLTEMTKQMPRVKNKRIHPSTLWRWCKKGVHGIYLDHACVGRTIVTSHAALGHFFIALAEADRERSEPTAARSKPKKIRPRSDVQRQRELEQAAAILRRAKIII
jgi:hypothetical protein